MNRSFFKFENCLSLNFDYFDVNLSIPQIAATPESELMLNFDFPSSCFFSVMEKVDSILNDIGGAKAMAVFITSNSDRDDIDIDIDYSFDRNRSTPVMVK